MSGSVPGLCPLAADTALCSDSHACLRTLPGVPVGPRHARRGLVRELAAIGCLPLQLSTSPIESILFLTPNLFLPVVNGSVTHPTDCSHGKTWEPPWTAPPPSPASGQSALRLLNSTSLDLDPVPVTHSPPPPRPEWLPPFRIAAVGPLQRLLISPPPGRYPDDGRTTKAASCSGWNPNDVPPGSLIVYSNLERSRCIVKVPSELPL